jgi:hypothetical protein
MKQYLRRYQLNFFQRKPLSVISRTRFHVIGCGIFQPRDWGWGWGYLPDYLLRQNIMVT